VVRCLALTLLLGVANVFLWRSLQAAQRQHDEVKRQGETMIRTLTNRPRIDADLAALEDAVAYIERDLIEEQSMEVNLGYFYKLEKITRVRLVRLNQLAAPVTPAGALFKAVPFSMQVAGSYRNSMNFLRSLETGPCILRVRNCSFERVPESGDVVVDLFVEILARI
jgi:Tfp pilus assembly protein PilO